MMACRWIAGVGHLLTGTRKLRWMDSPSCARSVDTDSTDCCGFDGCRCRVAFHFWRACLGRRNCKAESTQVCWKTARSCRPGQQDDTRQRKEKNSALQFNTENRHLVQQRTRCPPDDTGKGEPVLQDKATPLHLA